MMRRWGPWILGVACVVALVLALFQVRPAAPYRFLEGRKSIDMMMAQTYMGSTSPPEAEWKAKMYSFRGSFEEVVRRATPELNARGLADIGSGTYGGSGDSSRVFMTEKIAPRQPGWLRVTVFKDVQVIDSKTARFKGGRPGWVTVIVEGAEEPSWFDSFRAWVGL